MDLYYLACRCTNCRGMEHDSTTVGHSFEIIEEGIHLFEMQNTNSILTAILIVE